MNPYDNYIDMLRTGVSLSREEFSDLIENRDKADRDALQKAAVEIRRKIYGDDVYIRGLIEFSSYCKNDCLYCGLRRSNSNAERYRLTSEEILEAASYGHEIGFRTFVLQGGEDPFYTAEKIADIVSSIKERFPDSAVTLSIGERKYEEYKLWKAAGCDRYLLRHETADGVHYSKLHPAEMSLENRKKCLYELRSLGYQVGCGFMVGSPYQSADTLAEDMLFIKDLKPEMVGIGPFIPHHDTPFKDEPAGSVELTLFLLSLIRLMLPEVLLPATTALGTLDPLGREKGLKAGANVLMPNLSPLSVRKKYLLYDNKICLGEEGAECLACLGKRVENAGFSTVMTRGDHIKYTSKENS